MTGLSSGKERGGIFNASRTSYWMDFIGIKNEATPSPLYIPLLKSYKQT